ncbi:hypothetical protein [Psychroserpens burtonensis]|uniref:hypothetical protein n=1 Tax=Psychroserpens burtonensis TaxID=49278 RepID=UPI00040DD932|nr:hypothetical protein [Psychroserpens burtonensis]
MADNVRKSQRQNPYTFTGATENPPKNRKIACLCQRYQVCGKPKTNIDAIRNNGISFSNFWSNPTCTPTRASIITGKYG